MNRQVKAIMEFLVLVAAKIMLAVYKIPTACHIFVFTFLLSKHDFTCFSVNKNKIKTIVNSLEGTTKM